MLPRVLLSRCRMIPLALSRRISPRICPSSLRRYSRPCIYTLPWTGVRSFSRATKIQGPLNSVTYEQVCDDTLDSLCEVFEELVENAPHLQDTDVNLGDGVLTVQFGSPFGTYVINRQRPNLQIWLSSPTSGPKRYDFSHGQWVYKHDGCSLHQLLETEISVIMKKPVDFSQCAYYGKPS